MSIIDNLTQHAVDHVAKQMEVEILLAVKSMSPHDWTMEEINDRCHTVHVGGGWMSFFCDGRHVLDVGPVTSSATDGKLVIERGVHRLYADTRV